MSIIYKTYLMYPNYQNQNQTFHPSQQNITQPGYQSYSSNYPQTNMNSSLNVQPSFAQQQYSNNYYQPSYTNNYQPNTNSFVVEQVQYQNKQYGIGTGLNVSFSNDVGFGNSGVANLGNTQINTVIGEPEVRRKQSQTIDP